MLKQEQQQHLHTYCTLQQKLSELHTEMILMHPLFSDMWLQQYSTSVWQLHGGNHDMICKSQLHTLIEHICMYV
jgi:hypothetical protein